MKELSKTVDEARLQPAPPASVEPTPARIGRYRVERLLGKGGFGLVYLAFDDQLQRPVAIKVPHSRLVARATEAEAYLTEARTVAGLDHPNIVPVFDVGSTDQFPCFVVSKYIDGSDLAARLRQSRLSLHETAELVATVAEALHHAHKQGLVHRDIKPGNILLDKIGKPFVGDFGLTLREQDVGKGPRYVGTPAYMSPEQARGEGHRVDGRSDIFSLGVVFYELLVGRRPFQGESKEDLLDEIASVETRPPRQIDDAIPKELDRICLKALSKRASERYSAARDLADDLRHFLIGASDEEKSTLPGKAGSQTDVATAVATPTTPAGSDSQPIKIVPKGLRSFDAHDADFFLELLPGPRDRDGLSDSIRFWKTRIESTDADGTFSVGLMYGPSGCGKSSLVKAGLLPRLANSLMAVYIEATANETEARLLKTLRRQLPNLPGGLGLNESLAALRRGRFLESGQKVLLVLDQFEQWLHAKRNEENTELVQALRQCDGGRLQCVVMVRDDFWMAATRFMRDLEVSLLEGQNSAAVDLFPIRHAEKVLAAFGRAFGELPPTSSADSKEQRLFLHQAVAGLAQEGKVISVRLALFAEMVKGKPWTPATLKEVGGTEGVGVTFLEETFTASTAPPQHRLHQKAAQAVLKALLPESGTDIKGHMRSQRELLEASGYLNRPQDFHDLMRILDSELRLITPADEEGSGFGVQGSEKGAGDGEQGGENPKSPAPSPQSPASLFYQLTHDYLVPSLRNWLTRKQKETRKGRAQLLLADRAVVWNARPENRQLPSLLQSLQIQCLTQKKHWSPPQTKMMRRAGRMHTFRCGVVALLFAVACFIGLETRRQFVENRQAKHAEGLVHAIVNAGIAQVPTLIGEIAGYRKWADPLLQEEFGKAEVDSPQKLHASLALLPVDSSQVDFLYFRLLDAKPNEVPVIVDALTPHKDLLLDKLWRAVELPEKGKETQRLRAAAALGKYDHGNEKWAGIQSTVGNDLVAVPAVYLSVWMDSLRPVRLKLLAQLSAIFRDTTRRETERSLATDMLAEFLADQPQQLADLLMDSEEAQFVTLFPKLKNLGDAGSAFFNREIDLGPFPLDVASSDPQREIRAKRQANAAVALLRLEQPEEVWKLLAFHPQPDDPNTTDPRVRSYLIHRLAPLGANPDVIIQRLNHESDITIRRALVLSLGEFGNQSLPEAIRNELLPTLREIYKTDSDPGLHSAVEWLLRRWKQDEWLTQLNEEWSTDETREDRLAREKTFTGRNEKTTPQWYVNSQGQTMVVIPGPVEFIMGSPETEQGRSNYELYNRRRISRTFALSTTDVTLQQYREYWKDFGVGSTPDFVRQDDLPAVGVSWYMGAKYCNWLSEREQLQPCYEIKGDEVSLKQNYLSLNGYRFPTKAEMEYATRAGTTTSRYFGETDSLLPNYAWYQKNSGDLMQPVGHLKPNDFGFVDILGNVWGWCQDQLDYYPVSQEITDDEEGELAVIATSKPLLHGGSWVWPASASRSAAHTWQVVSISSNDIGFRLARTLLPAPHTPLSAINGGIREAAVPEPTLSSMDLTYVTRHRQMICYRFSDRSREPVRSPAGTPGWIGWLPGEERWIALVGKQLLRLPVDETSPPETLWTFEAAPENVAVSPDGKRLCWARKNAENEAPHLMAQRFDDEPPQDLGFGYDPNWSADSQRLTYVTWTNPWSVGVWDGKTVSFITPPCHKSGYVYPAFAPDGKHIAYGGRGRYNNRQIAVMTVDGAQIRLVTRNSRMNLMPAYSPDGRYLAYVRSDPEGNELAFVDLLTEEEEVVANDAAAVRPVWRRIADSP